MIDWFGTICIEVDLASLCSSTGHKKKVPWRYITEASLLLRNGEWNVEAHRPSKEANDAKKTPEKYTLIFDHTTTVGVIGHGGSTFPGCPTF